MIDIMATSVKKVVRRARVFEIWGGHGGPPMLNELFVSKGHERIYSYRAAGGDGGGDQTYEH
jgi:hypothetical protein